MDLGLDEDFEKASEKRKDYDKLLMELNSSISFSDILDKHYLVYDIELNAFYKAFENCYKLIRQIHKRFTRQKTLNISRSLARYIELENDKSRYPYMLYDFRYGKVRICITKLGRYYTVRCLNYSPSVNLIDIDVSMIKDCCYGRYVIIDNAIQLFNAIVNDFSAVTRGDLL